MENVWKIWFFAVFTVVFWNYGNSWGCSQEKITYFGCKSILFPTRNVVKHSENYTRKLKMLKMAEN